MIIVGALLVFFGVITVTAALWSFGAVICVAGLIMWALGATGHGVAGRRHYY